MTYQLPPDIQQSVRTLMAAGRYASEDDVLRDALRALTDERDDFEAVEEALSHLEQGDAGVVVGRLFRELRERSVNQRQP